MEQNILDLTFDNDKFSASKQQVLTGLNQIIALAGQIEDSKIAIGTDASFAKLNKQITEQAKQLKLLEEANLKYIKSQEQVTKNDILVVKQMQEEEKQMQQEIKTNKMRTAEREKLTKAMRDESIGADGLVNEYQKLQKDYKAMADNAKLYYVRLGEGHPVTLQARADAEQMRKVLEGAEKSVGDYRRNVGNYASANMGFLQILREAPNATQSFDIFIRSVSNNTAQFTDDIKKMRTDGKSWIDILKSLGGTLLSLGGITAIATVALTLLPSLLKAAGTHSSTAAKSFKELAVAADATKENYANLNEVLKKGNEEAGKGLTTAKILYQSATDVNESAKMRVASAKELQKLYPEQFKNQSTEIIMNGNAKKSYDDLTQSIIANARAKAARDKLEKLAADELDILEKNTKIRNAMANEKARVKTAGTTQVIGGNGLGLGNGGIYSDVADQQRMIMDRGRKAFAETNAQMEKIRAQQQFLTDFIGKEALAKEVIDDDHKKASVKTAQDLTNELIKIEQDRLKALAEMSRLELEALAATEKAIADDESNSFGIRMLGYKSYADTRKAMAKLDSDEEQDVINVKLRAIEKIEKISIGKRTEEQKKLLLEKSTLLTQQQVAEEKGAIAIQKIELETVGFVRDLRKKEQDQLQKDEDKKFKTVEEAEKKALDYRKKSAEDRANSKKGDIVSVELEGITKLNDAYSAGLITTEKYNKEKVKLARTSAMQILLIDAELIDAQISIARKAGERTGELTRKREAIRLAIAKATGEKLVADEEDTNSKRIKLINSIVEYEGYAVQLLQGLKKAAYQDELNRISDLKDKQDAYYAAQAQNVQNSTLSEEKKAAALAIIKNQQETSDRAFDLRKRAAQTKQAEFEKKIALFQIVLNTAAAVVKALIDPGGLTGAALSIAAGVKGAVEFAVALATPVPHYAFGTDDHPGGAARYGEAGPEYVKEPGKPGRVVTKDTTGPLAKHAIVMPVTQDFVTTAMKIGADRTAQGLNWHQNTSNDAWEIAKWQRDETKKIMKSLSNRPIKNVVVVKGAFDVNKIYGR